MNSLKDLDWKPDANLTLLKCNLGFMSLVPNVITKHHTTGCPVRIPCLIRKVIYPSFLVEQNQTSNDRDSAAHVAQTIRRVDRRLNQQTD